MKAKKYLLGFCEGSACVSGKAKCTTCWLAKIVFKNVGGKKNK